MSSSTVSVPTLNALFKEVYADQVENLIPERELITKSVPFVSNDKQNGREYIQPVILSRDHGVTYLGDNSQNLQLNPPVAAIVDRAAIKASGMVMRGLMDYQAASRAEKGGPSFIDGTSYLVESISDSFAACQEQTFFYGSKGLAAFAGATAVLAVNQVQITLAEFAPAIWCGAEGMPIDIYSDSSGSATNTKVLSTEVTAVDITNRKLTLASVSGLADGTTYHIFRRQSKNLESIGMHAILANTGSMFGIDASARGLWAANQYAVGSTELSFQKVAEAVAIAYGRGLEGSIDLHVNSKVFNKAIPDFITSKAQTFTSGSGAEASQQGRSFSSQSEVENLRHGSKAIKFIINSVEVNLIANDYVKTGYAFGMANGTWLRVGSSEMTFDLPDVEKGQYFRQLDGYAALEIRAYQDQALLCTRPNRNILFTGISV